MEKLSQIAVRYLKGVGPKREKTFNKAGIYSIEDLFYYFPRRYEDRTDLRLISELKEGQTYTIKASILARGARRSFRRSGFSIVEAAVGDESGVLNCVWFNQPYLKNYFQPGQTLILYGKVERYAGRLQMSAPEFEVMAEEEEPLSMGRIVPVYSLPQGISQRNFRRMVKQIIDGYTAKVNDFLPYDIRSRNNLLNLARSLINIHFPENQDLQKEAYRRLAFEEFFLFQLPLAIRKLKRKEKTGIAHKVEGELADVFLASLPFKLTASQLKVLDEIKSDMAKPVVMQRLIQGDVGSGKTVVATLAGLMAVQGGFQAAFMVPTEILAKQHYNKISAQLAAINAKVKKVSLGLLTGSGGKKAKEQAYRKIKEGKFDIVIGTHALLEEDVEFKNLGLVVIDEQHKFGVGQRALLPKKALNPDVLIMTATPIPRTLAITLYGDLDVSVIDELPAGRPVIKTMYFGCDNQDKAYEIAKEELRQGRQAFIVYPVIEESYALDIAGAKRMYEQFKAEEFRNFRIGLIHGKLKQADQDEVMSKFKNKELDIIVSTTVLEVGIDIPNATCMIIQNAERFGLSQLHQLRGRVGRGTSESFCILVSDAKTEESKARIEAMVKYKDGFRIAEVDLKIRGAGEFFGRRQHGLTELKIGDILTQMQLLKRAREDAIKLVSIDPDLAERQNAPVKERLLQRFPEYKEYTLAG